MNLKKIATLALVLLSSFGFSQIKIQGKITNAPLDSFSLSGGTVNQNITIAKDGKFSTNITAPSGLYQVLVKDQYALVYIEDKKNISFTVDYSKFDETIKFTGDLNVENNYLAKKLGEQNPSDFAGVMAAENEEQLKTEFDKVVNKVTGDVPAKSSPLFVEAYKGMYNAQFAQIQNYMKGKLLMKKLNGSDAPAFDYENHKGGKTKLADLKGKYVYVDVWATWCGPCRAEIPSLKKTEEAYHGKNIEFVSISIDEQKDYEKWKKFVTEKSLGGVQLFAENAWQSAFTKGLQINSIPRFVIISPDGKIVDADAPRPSDPKLVSTLDTLLK